MLPAKNQLVERFLYLPEYMDGHTIDKFDFEFKIKYSLFLLKVVIEFWLFMRRDLFCRDW